MVLALALTQHEADLCPGCGQPRHESMDPANEGRYESPLPARCHACTAVEMRVLEYRDVKPEMAPGALKFSSALAVRLDASTAGRTGP